MSSEILNLVRPELLAMKPYSSARMEQQQGQIWLNANENPWNTAELWNRYPEPQSQLILEKMSAIYQINAEQLVMLRGSDEGIDLLIRLFCVAGQDAIMITPPTFGMYQVNAMVQNAEVIAVPLLKKQDFALDVTAILQQWQPKIKLIFLCSPNNPTGNLFSATQILQLCNALKDRAVIVVDEAYVEFADTASLTASLKDYDNLVILRTLSKAYGLAGIRCGFVLAAPMIIKLLKTILAPYPVPRPILDIIKNFLTETNLKLVQQQIAIIKQQRNLLMQQLAKLPYIKYVWPSQANFILCEMDNPQQIMQLCQAQGIVLRDRSKDYNLENCIRITVSTPEENQLLLKVLKNAA